jgi:hypothetical protein
VFLVLQSAAAQRPGEDFRRVEIAAVLPCWLLCWCCCPVAAQPALVEEGQEEQQQQQHQSKSKSKKVVVGSAEPK